MNAVIAVLHAVLIAVCLCSLLHAILAASFARSWKSEPLKTEVELPTLTLLRPIKAGIPALREKLTELANAMRPGDRLVLGVNAGSQDAAVAETVRAENPEQHIVVVLCQADAALNPKISKLVQMDAAAAGEHLVLSDAEARIDRMWLDAFRREWAASGADAMTCGYRFEGGVQFTQTLDAAPTLFSLWPGLLFVRRFSRLTFTLGACTALRRSDLAIVGGWAAFSDQLAEDNRLGAALVKAGRHIRLSQQVAVLESDPLSWRDYWRHQRRVAVTYRVSNAAGFAGSLCTHSVAAGLLLVALSPSRALILFFWFGLQIIRWQNFQRVAAILGQRRMPPFFGMILSEFVETLCWFLAWFSPRVWWAGKWWRISRDGTLHPR